MTRIAQFCMVAIQTIWISACCHTNNFSDHPLSGQKLLFSYSVKPDAASVRLHISNPTPGHNVITDIVVGAGTEILSSEAQEKLNRAVRPEGIAAAVSTGIEKVLTTHLRFQGVSADQDPECVVETLVEECNIESGSTGIELSIKARTEMIHRATGDIIWRDCLEEKVMIKHTPAGAIPLPGIGTAASIYNAAEFFRLSEKEIQEILLQAAEETGRKLGESIRNDYSKSH